MFFFRLFLLSLTMFVSLVHASNPIERVQIEPTTHKIEYFSQDNREYFIDYVAKLDDKQWLTANKALDFGFVSKSYWIRVTLDIPTSQKHWFLEASNPLIDKLEVYIKDRQGFIHYQAGDTIATSERPTLTKAYLYPLPLDQNNLTIYLKYTGLAASSMPLAIVTASEALSGAATDAFSYGILFSLLLIIIVGSLFTFFIVRNNALLYFSGYTLTCFMLLTIIEGYASLVIWPQAPWMQNLLSPSLTVLCLWLLTIFTGAVLNFEQRLSVQSFKLFKLFTRIQIISGGVLLVLPLFMSALTAVIILILSLCYLVVVVCLLLKSKQPVSYLYPVSGIAFIAAMASKITFLTGLGMPSDMPQLTRLFLGIHLALISIALIKQAYTDYLSTKRQQQDELHAIQEVASREQHEHAEREEEHLNLEALVDERTFELNVTLRELQETNRRLEEQATNDALTGAKNRNFFDQRLQAEYRLSRRQQTPLSLLMLDIDFFKKVNDNYGHLMGDKVLVSIANKAMSLLRRPNDYVCRYGGEEFAVLLSSTDHKGAMKVAELIRSKLEKHAVSSDGIQINVTVSIGVSTIIIDDNTPKDHLFKLADKALYHAKEHGRNRVSSALDALK